ncbi:MAG: serine hydrolase domain-containing protein [Sphingomicrobium sp.]
MRLSHSTVLVLVAAVLSMAASSPARVPTRQPETGSIDHTLDEYLKRFASYGYAFSFLAARDGRVVLAKAYGTGLTTESVFNIASVSKQFTATAILKLVQERKLSLSDPISRYLPGAPASFANITVDHLLAHTSGIRDDYGLYERLPKPDAREIKDEVYKRTLGSKPGEMWEYSNDGYWLLAMIVQTVARQPFADFVRDNFFKPAGMTNSGFMSDRWPQSQWPTPFGGSLPPEPRGKEWSGRLGPSAVVSTPGDLFRWQQALESGRVLRSDLVARLTEPQIVAIAPTLSYARGWWVRQANLGVGPVLNVFHSGVEDDGSNAWFSRFPDRRLSLIFTSHQAWEGVPLREALFAAGAASPLEALLFGGEVAMPPPVQSVEVTPFAGRYRLAGGAWIEVAAAMPFLKLIPHGQAAFDMLLPDGSGETAAAVLLSATERTKHVMDRLAGGDISPFRQAVGDRDDGSVLQPPLFDTFEVLGSYPLRTITTKRQLVITHAFLTRSGQRSHYHFHWDGDSLVRLWRDDQPIIPGFRAVGPQVFANLHPFIRGTTRIRFINGLLIAAGKEARIE